MASKTLDSMLDQLWAAAQEGRTAARLLQEDRGVSPDVGRRLASTGRQTVLCGHQLEVAADEGWDLEPEVRNRLREAAAELRETGALTVRAGRVIEERAEARSRREAQKSWAAWQAKRAAEQEVVHATWARGSPEQDAARAANEERMAREMAEAQAAERVRLLQERDDWYRGRSR